MTHPHAHHAANCDEHSHGRARDRQRLAIVLILVTVYMLAEFIGGVLTNSLALVADAGHMLSDAAALALSLFALWIAERPANPRRTYGYYRAEILAALVNGATLIAIAILIFVEAYRRFAEPPEVMGGAMMAIAGGGLAINAIGLWLLHSSQSGSLNLRAAWLHLLGDALGSVGAIAAGLLIWGFGWYWADPLASVLIGALVLYSSWSLVKESVAVLMESTPKNLDVDCIRDAVVNLDGVEDVHALHVWSITSGLDSLSAHVVVTDGEEHAVVLGRVRQLLHDRFDIDHITIQIEPAGFEERRANF
ncbi:MAG: cation diffusion facilitator family transporter [Pirellulales bacterium]